MPNAPHVTAVVVVHNPGTWFQEMIESLRDSDYPNISYVFVDTSSDIDVTSAIEGALPSALIVKEPANPGFAAACNIGARHAKGASHLLFCHDDVAFDPGAIRKMVEEAFLMNAGVVTPKYVVWNSPGQILALGGSIDRTGSVASRIDVGDLDQGQYDASQEVFVAPGGATLIRRDLFEAIFGFDEKMFLYYEDVDLSWRAQIAGARIVASPLAKVRHLTVSTVGARRARGGRRRVASSVRARLPRHERLGFSRKNQLRALLTNVRGLRRQLSMLQYFVISLVETAYFAITGKPKIALAMLEAWFALFSQRSNIRKKRRSILHYRVKSDVALNAQMIRGSARVKGFANTRRNFRSRGEEARKVSGWRDYGNEKTLIERLTAPSATGSKGAEKFDDTDPVSIAFGRLTRVFMWVVVALVIIGTRHLTVGQVSLFGQFLPFGSAHGLIATYFLGPAHHQGLVSPSPTMDLLLGALGYVFFGGTGLEAHFVYAALIALGLAGIFRIVADFRSRAAAYVGTAIYAIGPILPGVISSASLSGLVVFGVAPWFFLRMLRFVNMPGIFRSTSVSSRYELVVEGLWLGLILAFAPSFVIVFVVTFIVLAIMGAVHGYIGSLKKFIVSQIGALVVALALNSPWIFSFFVPGANPSAFFGSATPAHLNVQALLLFQIAPEVKVVPLFGSYLIAFFGSLVLVRRLKADRVISLMAVFAAVELVAIFSSYGSLGLDPIHLSVVLPMAFLVAVVVICSGIEAALIQLPRMKIGWGHFASVFSAIAIVISTFAMVSGNGSGRYGLPPQGYGHSLGWMVPSHNPSPEKALWLGRPGTLPVGSYQISSDMALGLSDIGRPTIDTLFPTADPNRIDSVIKAVSAASREDTVHLGQQLAKLRIKYVVIPQSSLSSDSFLTSDLNLMLSRQRDLNQLVADPSVAAFAVQDSLANPVSAAVSQSNRELNFLRLIIEILVAVLWAGMIEATLSSRSITLWLLRRFMNTLLGRFLSRLAKPFRFNFQNKERASKTRLGPAPDPSLETREKVLSTSLSVEQRYRHVRITNDPLDPSRETYVEGSEEKYGED